MAQNIHGKAIYNDVIDEVYELEDGEEVIEERKIKNQLVDGEVSVSDDSQNYIQTPRENQSEIKQSREIGHFNENLELDHEEDTFRKSRPYKSLGQIQEDLKDLNLDAETLEIFKYIPAYIPQTIELETKLKPFIPEYVPAVGEVDAFLKIPRPDGKEETLGLERLDEYSN